MKSKLTFILVFLTVFSLQAQNVINLNYDAAKKELTKTTKDADVAAFDPLSAIVIKVANIGTEPLVVTAKYNANIDIATSKQGTDVSLAPLAASQIQGYKSYDIKIEVGNTASVTYSSVAKPKSTASSRNTPNTTAFWVINTLFPKIEVSDYGLIITQVNNNGYKYLGEKYTHIFLDQFGTVLLGVLPQGIANRQYIVHVIYLTEKDNPNRITYSINQTKGSFNPTLVFNNAGQMGNYLGTQSGNGEDKSITYVWEHQEFPLRISTDNIEFELNRNSISPSNPLVLETAMIARKTIEMTKLYHGSFDVGILNTRLANPSYEHVPSASAADQKVVKESNQGDRIVMTAMATFYVSPVVLLESLMGIDIPKYKLYGRNFFDDHKIYERIFPSVGVAVSEKALKNVFFGLNWEIVRGGSIFCGVHYGEVNTFSRDNNFKFMETPITDADFTLRNNKQWRRGFSFGANLDILVITNLLKAK